MTSIDDILKMAANVQEEMGKAQAALDLITVEGVSGGGLVKVRATAKGRVQAVEIDPSLLAPQEKAMVEDLIVAAFNDARAKADTVSNAEMSKMTAGMSLPPGFTLPS
jgi:nucleoid-associated protein EbfC